MATEVKSVGIAEFAKRNFVDGGVGRSKFNVTSDGFAGFINDNIELSHVVDAPQNMPFCKYLFIPNFTSAGPAHLRIDNSNYYLLKAEYESRTEEELPVLIRYFNLQRPLPPAKMLMVILYSREQLLKEAKSGEQVPEHDWSVVSVIPLDSMEVPPMPPITAFRNSLGISEGGNGVPLDRAQYLASVEYWKDHAEVRCNFF